MGHLKEKRIAEAYKKDKIKKFVQKALKENSIEDILTSIIYDSCSDFKSDCLYRNPIPQQQIDKNKFESALKWCKENLGENGPPSDAEWTYYDNHFYFKSAEAAMLFRLWGNFEQ